jgi:multidrug efflux pump subunit AcrA (membrane-fusion protein)
METKPNDSFFSGIHQFFKPRSRFSAILYVTIIYLLLSSCSSKKEEQKDTYPVLDMTPTRVIGLGRIEPELKILNLTSETSGIVTKIDFQPGDTISQGQTIIELLSTIEKARVEQATARIQAQASQIEAARAALAATKIKTENAKLTFERAKKLYEQDAEAKFNYDLAQTEYESLLEEIKRLEANVIVARNLLKQYQADRKLAQAEFNRKFITVLTDGQLLSLDITLGSLISPEKPFATFAPKSPLTAWCEIDELFALEVRVGQKAYVRYPGTTDPLAWGKISYAGPYLRKKSIFSDEIGDLEDRRVREVRINLEPDANLLFGSRVECVILLKE